MDIVVNRKRGWAAIFIPRCGGTSLKYAAYLDQYGKPFDIEQKHTHIHEYLRTHDNDIVFQSLAKTDGLIRFAVWRPPIERSYSLWRGFTQRDGWRYGAFRPAWKKDWSHWCRFLPRHFRSGGRRDPHVMPQTNLYDPDRLDFIVPIYLLDIFMMEKFDQAMEHHASSRTIQVEQGEMKARDTAKIAKLYVADDMIPLHKSFWRGP